jgi:hypothetical protein
MTKDIKPGFNKPSLGLPNMGMLKPIMPQIPSGPKFNVPTSDDSRKQEALRKEAAMARRPAQSPANNNSSVYNYNLSVNVASQSDPNTIAQTVMAQIQKVESQRVRNGRF